MGRLKAPEGLFVLAGRYRAEVKVREVITLLESDGWRVDRTRGSHRQYRNATKPGTITVAGKPADVLHPKTLSSILTKAGLKE